MREPSKDTEKGDGVMKLCVNDAQSAAGERMVLLPEWQRGPRG